MIPSLLKQEQDPDPSTSAEHKSPTRSNTSVPITVVRNTIGVIDGASTIVRAVGSFVIGSLGSVGIVECRLVRGVP